MNSVKLSGRLTDEPKIAQYTTLDSEKNEVTAKRAGFILANNLVKGRKSEDANFIRCVAFRKTAEIIEKYCSKGTPIIVEGSIKTGSYKKDGQTIYTTDVIVDNIELISSNNQSQTDNKGASADSEFTDMTDTVNSGLDLPF